MQLQKIVDAYNMQAVHEISYAVGYEVSYKNHYYLVQDLMKHADEKMYRDKAFKKGNSDAGCRAHDHDERAGRKAVYPEK